MTRFLFLALAALTAYAQAPFDSFLAHPLLDPDEPLLDVQVYTGTRVPLLPSFTTRAQWEAYAAKLRQRVLNEVVFRGEAVKWRDAKTKMEIEPPFAKGDGYTVRRFKMEILPGFWSPGLIYEPANLMAKAPVVLNVNGHEGNGNQTPYIQTRCINLAKKGLIAVNPEWIGRGQLNVPDQVHYAMNQLDLVGTSGLSIFYLQMKRAIDLALTLPHADAARLAVTGLSGGGWQTIFISALDPRVAMAMPVAGYSSYVTRAQWPQLDLGDSEQTPSDLAAVADYTHLTAMMAPRRLVISNNAKDNCCFRADYALAPLIQAATPIYKLFGMPARLSYHVSHDAGHNYDVSNREALYRALRETFNLNFDPRDGNVDADIRPQEQLRPALPENNLDFHQIALQLAKGLPRPGGATREKLRSVVRFQEMNVEARPAGSDQRDGIRAVYWKLRIGGAWTVPAVELYSGAPTATTVLLSDAGRANLAALVREEIAAGRRVIAIDPFYFGESRIAKRDFLYAMLLAGLSEPPLGLQASQIAAVARWAGVARKLGPVGVRSVGPRLSLAALVAAAADPAVIAGHQSSDAYGSLHDILKKNLTVDKAPELFCFGLLHSFDIPQLEALARR
ncbi:MAG: acetylxylan esterase [Bryobacterales bacterium]|nr:acetylxylan esterase [Bryobacterales bacterium]